MGLPMVVFYLDLCLDGGMRDGSAHGGVFV